MNVVKSLLLFALAATSLAESSAPVLVWESAKTTAPVLPSLPAMSNAQLQSHLNSLDSEALVMFIMNELNVEDFSGYPSAFPQLREEFESSQNAFTPSMSDPSQIPAHLDSYSRVTVNVDDLASLKLAPGAAKTLFVVYISDRPAAERQTALEQSDAVISRVLARVKKLTGSYSAVLTGKHTTMGGEARGRTTRSLKAAAAEEDASGFLNLGCVFIYTLQAPTMRFSVPASSSSDKASILLLDLGDPASKTSDCNSTENVNTATLSWKDKSVTADGHSIDLTSVTLTFSFRAKMSQPEGGVLSSWTLAPVTLAYTGTIDKATVNVADTALNFGDVYAPSEFSYHCTNRSWELSAKANSTDKVAFSSLLLPGFQVQAFLADGAPEHFGRAWDCTTFFTIPIWSGLFLSLILLLVLIWSLMMLASVPTMDRFDDPRGQPLHVPNSE